MENQMTVLNSTLNKLIKLYSESDVLFMRSYRDLPYSIKNDIAILYKTHDLTKTKYKELPDMAGEVLFYIDMYDTSKDDRVRSTNLFTLRNQEDLIVFDFFLKKMVKLLELSPFHFIRLFPKCPPVLWDKVDDLRETSFKIGKESEIYTECLKNSRKLSFGFAELSGVSTNNYE